MTKAHIRKALIAVCSLAFSAHALAATAYWTGRQEMVQTVTYQTAWRCEYRYAGNSFWAMFNGSCPSSIEVQ